MEHATDSAGRVYSLHNSEKVRERQWKPAFAADGKALLAQAVGNSTLFWYCSTHIHTHAHTLLASIRIHRSLIFSLSLLLPASEHVWQLSPSGVRRFTFTQWPESKQCSSLFRSFAPWFVRSPDRPNSRQLLPQQSVCVSLSLSFSCLLSSLPSIPSGGNNLPLPSSSLAFVF